MRFATEREAAYRNMTFNRQRTLLRVLVMFPAPMLMLFIYLQSLLTGIPFDTWLHTPMLYVLLAVLVSVGLGMQKLTRSAAFAWIGVLLMSLYCLSCALMTLPGPHDTIALMLPLYIASPLVIAPFWARLGPVIVMILLSYLAGTVALVRTDASATLWLAYWMQALVGASVALFSHVIVDRARRGHFLATMQLEQYARIDALTSLLNRRHFIEAGEALVGGMDTRSALSACFVDLDHFKRLNDEGSHRIGDQMLVEAAKRLQSAGGNGRLIGRLGGEEFALLLHGMSILQAQALAEALRAGIAEIQVEGFALTASVGVAEWRPGESLSDLLHRADIALLTAKRTGRNRSVTWSPELLVAIPA
ncbi:GGDEF domain-containing protein [Thermomonas sp. HDW16]|uniref:GGDEF domain-containing protein n=1 Tax=Thermomonas sp. HDW16 TaxID=2714945 RepID=UPI00140C7565|nr:GGDEF domain-containing protein [Thermomonas sp. HDW16]QIL21398.1 GGDEF domain-containing protein [Thermomonas sp. HDW16]